MALNIRRKKEIAIAADDFRRKFNVIGYGIENLFKCCENANYRVIRYPLSQYDMMGFTMWKDDDVVIYTNSGVRLSREMFTLAHEIGHAILHTSVSGPFIDDCVSISGNSSDEFETEANYFAINLLIPKDQIQKYFEFEVDCTPSELNALDIVRIMSEFNVSFETVLNRLENLEFITKSERTKLDTEKTLKKVGNLLNSVGGKQELNRPSNIIDIPHQYLEQAVYNYNHGAIPKETLEKILGYYQLDVDDINDQLIPEDDGLEELDLEEMIRGL